ncbi:MAG: pyrroloquinoline quinone-dependent dehydrogenase [Gammaproteobacteria bacterium]|nr:pyrroloquinoline quinone-dependent dehydrogenase [Gammaproteobacteria bacterium]
MKNVKISAASKWFHRLLAGVIIVSGVGMAAPGLWLISLGGSVYYLVAGMVLSFSGFLLWKRQRGGVPLFLGMLAATFLWSIAEAGFDGWALAPRLAFLLVLGLLLLVNWLLNSIAGNSSYRKPLSALGGAILIVVAGVLSVLDLPQRPGEPVQVQPAVESSAGQIDGEWRFVGGSSRSDRFSDLQQITPDNVGKLELAWKVHLGESDLPIFVIEATPLMVDGALYVCNSQNEVFALDPDTGRTLWRFDPELDGSTINFRICRGVAYFRQPGATGSCSTRILSFAMDARLFAVDSKTGKRCPNFGNNGEVDLLQGMGTVSAGYYTVTSAPTVVRGKVLVGGYVADGQRTGAPSGAIRAFDAVTGDFAWAWDMGRPGDHGLPPPGESFTPGTPNSWAPITGDEELGLAYVPLGSATPDYVTSHRSAVMNKYGNSVVAIDAETGTVRWFYQTSHLDAWDYDVASPATLVEFPTSQGLRPALIQPTKRGEFFVLDRITGEPLVETVERPVPQNPVPGEPISPTQPYPEGMPSFGGEHLTEADMWGTTPFDQLWCRIKFRQARYDGDFTPIGLKPTVVKPGYLGGSEWPGVAVDQEKQIMVLNVNHFAMYNQMITRTEAEERGIQAFEAGTVPEDRDAMNIHAQIGTPYATDVSGFLSPLGVPCIQPPYSEIAAVDLETRKILWRQPLGTARDSGPFGLRFLLPIRMGVPAIGGPLVTGSGLIFIAATQERTLRAFELNTGRLLWQTRLPAGGHSSPMTYYSERSGRQLVVIPASGHFWMQSGQSDQLLAYALPE